MPSSSSPFGGALVLATVSNIQDPENLARVEVVFPLHADGDDAKTTAMAPIAQPFAGTDYGAFFVPNVGDVVVLGFLNNDSRAPIILGSVWHGQAAPSESSDAAETDRWAMKGRAGTRMAIVEEDGGSPSIELTTPGGTSLVLSDKGGGTITLKTGGSTLKLSPSEISTKTSTISQEGAEVSITAGSMSVEAPIADFSGVVSGQVGQMTTIIASTYTPGAGNVW